MRVSGRKGEKMRGEAGRIRRRVGGEERGRQEEDMEESGGKGEEEKVG